MVADGLYICNYASDVWTLGPNVRPAVKGIGKTLSLFMLFFRYVITQSTLKTMDVLQAVYVFLQFDLMWARGVLCKRH